ncbi:MAG: nucleotidyltransferase domain-containing protein [Candidatus Woesearchaeota archaeon]
MERILTILSPFFEDPQRRFGIRELSRILKINHTTVRQHLIRLKKEGYLEVEKEGLYSFYKIFLSRKTLNLKLYYNLEKIRMSGLVEEIVRKYDYPTIGIFGSYAIGMDYADSDIDICILTSITNEVDLTKFEKKLGRKISIHRFSEKSWSRLKKTNPNLVNNIANGIVLSGQMVLV